MKTFLRCGAYALLLCAASPARADDKAACVDAASRGQTLRDAHKLVEAREQFRVCAQRQCPAVVQKDCATWLDTVERSLATVVVTAKNAAGADLVDVTVKVDGQPLVNKLNGDAVPVNPGQHTFHFELADGTQLDQPVVVKEGEQNQSVAVVLKRPGESSAPPAAGVGASAAAGSTDHGVQSGGVPWKTVGWVVGGLGVVGLGVGTAFGVIAIGDKNSANCTSDNFCQSGPLHSARDAALIADIGIIAGGVFVAGGLALVLFSPSQGHEAARAVRVQPMVGANTRGLSVGGSW